MIGVLLYCVLSFAAGVFAGADHNASAVTMLGFVVMTYIFLERA